MLSSRQLCTSLHNWPDSVEQFICGREVNYSVNAQNYSEQRMDPRSIGFKKRNAQIFDLGLQVAAAAMTVAADSVMLPTLPRLKPAGWGRFMKYFGVQL